ncbi:MAG: hypothetical protein LC778_14795 [Acidobacteria bacterium]|nr:hypothetical protein [Acidobacteriota bacterium]
MALLTGQSPSEIESNWDELDVNMTLLVHQAQQDARISIAKENKMELHNVFAPVSVVLRPDED